MLTIEHLRTGLPSLCERFGVGRVDVFGSVARRNETAESDIDLLVEFVDESQIPYSTRFFGFKDAVEKKFQRKVDLLTASSVDNPYLLSEIEAERTHLYG